MKYANLAVTLSNKTIKQATAMIVVRLKKEATSYKEICENENRTTLAAERTCKSAKKINNDCMEWLTSAAFAFSADLWDSIVADYGIDAFCHEMLTDELN